MESIGQRILYSLPHVFTPQNGPGFTDRYLSDQPGPISHQTANAKLARDYYAMEEYRDAASQRLIMKMGAAEMRELQEWFENEVP
jgi:hypothetical protein